MTITVKRKSNYLFLIKTLQYFKHQPAPRFYIWTKFSHRIKSLLILPPNCHHQIMISKTQISSLSSATIWVGNLILLKSNNDHIRKTILFLRLSKKSCLPICPMTLLLVKIETRIDWWLNQRFDSKRELRILTISWKS